MAKPLVVIVEKEREDWIPLQISMAEALMDIADIEIITDSEYMEEYFTTPRTMDVLVIEESMYSEKLSMHTIGKTFVLVEDMGDGDEPVYRMPNASRDVICLFRYCNISTLVGYIIPIEWKKKQGKQKEPQIIAVISPAGGTGTTTVAMGLSACMKQNLKSALYLNMQNYQNFQFYLENKSCLPIEACTYLKVSDARIYEKMKPFMLKDDFLYLPPLRTTRESAGISIQGYMELARAAQKSGDFDFIIVEIGNELTSEVLKFLKYANKVYVVVTQDAYSTMKLDVMKYNINCSDKDKYIFVCNHFDKEKENALMGNVISVYIEKIAEDLKLLQCKDLRTVEGIQKATFLLL